MINIISSSRYSINRRKIREKAEQLFLRYRIPSTDTLNIVFFGKNKMRKLSKTYKSEDVALPVLSFSYSTDSVKMPFGEICICYPQAILLAAERDKAVDHIINQLIEHGLENILK